MIGRPDNSEAAPYYSGYISLAEGDDPLALLDRRLAEAIERLSRISEEQSQIRYAPGKWSLRQLLNHVTDTERALAFRALWFARGFDAPLPGYEQDLAAAGACADRVPWAAHVEEFRRVRLATLSLFENLPDEAWMRTGIASGCGFTVRALAFITAGHLAHHLRILEERYAPGLD
jgi:hypothetical protein